MERLTGIFISPNSLMIRQHGSQIAQHKLGVYWGDPRYHRRMLILTVTNIKYLWTIAIVMDDEVCKDLWSYIHSENSGSSIVGGSWGHQRSAACASLYNCQMRALPLACFGDFRSSNTGGWSNKAERRFSAMEWPK